MYCLISSSLPGYSGSEDCVAMETLLQGYDEQDEDQVYRVCNSPLLKYMDNDVSTKVSLLWFVIMVDFWPRCDNAATSDVLAKFHSSVRLSVYIFYLIFFIFLFFC